MNPNKLKRLFPNASKSFQRLNSGESSDTRMSNRGEQAEARPSTAPRNDSVEAQYRLRFIEIEFFGNHGKELDEDNRRYSAKPICDAMVNLGFDRDDKNIKTETTQRMDKTYIPL